MKYFLYNEDYCLEECDPAYKAAGSMFLENTGTCLPKYSIIFQRQWSSLATAMRISNLTYCIMFSIHVSSSLSDPEILLDLYSYTLKP
jgi:hypothetical protein